MVSFFFNLGFRYPVFMPKTIVEAEPFPRSKGVGHAMCGDGGEIESYITAVTRTENDVDPNLGRASCLT